MSQQPSFDELRRALRKSAVVIQEQQRALASYREPIAVIGMGCRFPGDVTSPAMFWDLLHKGISAASPRSVLQDYPGHYLGEPGWFDAAFFGIAPREAEAMDPQQHLLLEVCVEALQDANIAISDLLGSRTGVYIGVMNQDYAQLLGQQEVRSVYASSGSEMSFLAGRLSYSFGLHGPSMTVGTACSSSLVSTHLACQALRSHECHLAVAGGVSLILTPLNSSILAEMHATAPDGLSKTFDARADGYGRGEGCGVLILKRLTDAERDGDTIYALIRGEAVNHDGRSGGLTVPNGLAQEALIRQALAAAQVEGHAISYIEAHGTGTVLGDPIELRALSNVLGRERTNPLFVGSVKTNIGHLESAAGVAGLMKVILALRHRQIPPHLHLHEPNPHIPWSDVPLRVPTELTAWESDELRLAGISSFGLSGVNAHIILQEAPQRPTTPLIDPRPCHLLALSAKHPQALTDLLWRAHTHLLSTEGGAWGDICYTAQVGRAHYPYRLALVAASQAEATAQIAAYLTTHDPSGLQVGQIPQSAPQVAFLFTGQGSQYAGMGLDLDATEPTFHAALDACAAILDPLLGRPLRTVLTDPALIDQTTYTQPALFALEYALARMWQAWGIAPDILIGHSVGELVAACLAEVFSLDDGLRLVAARGRLMGDLPSDGSMVALAADEHRVREAVAPYTDAVSIAAVNGPSSVVIAGRTDRVHAIAAQFAANGVRTQALTVSHAFHSPLLDPMLEAFRAVAEGITYHPPTRRLVSNLTGELAGDAITTPDYWVRHVREAVRFADGMQTLHAQGVEIFLEIGPKPVLLGMVGDRGQGVALLPSVRAGQGAWQTLLTSLGTLYVRGAAVNWAGLHRAAVRHKVALPTYPFQRQRYWVDAPASGPLTSLTTTGGLTGRATPAVIAQVVQHGDFTPDEQALVARVFATLETVQQDADRDAHAAACTSTIRWQLAPPLSPPTTGSGSWLILADADDLGVALAESLRSLGATVIHMPLVAVADGIALLTAPPPAAPWRGVISLGGCDPALPDTADALLPDLEHRLSPLLKLLPALAAPLRLWVVTQGAQRVTERDAVALAQTPLWGLGRVIAREHSECWGGLLDLDPTDPPPTAAAAILAEVLAPDGTREVASRQGQRLVPRLVPSPSPRSTPPRIVPQATYLITGGLGGLGLAMATWLADQGATHLVLTGRRGVTEERQRTALDHLTSRGVTVRVAALDITDAAALAGLLDDLAQGTAPLTGVIHAAGVLDDGILLNQTWERFAAVLAPKVVGAWLLHRLTQHMDLDLLVFCSSISGVLGSAGQGNYAAANAFLDGLAHARQQQGLVGLSLAWGPWAEVGMAARTGAARTAGMTPLPTDLGLRALGRVLGERGGLTIIDADWAQVGAQEPLVPPVLLDLVPPPVVATEPVLALRVTLAALNPPQRDEQLRAEVAQVVARVLGLRTPPAPTTGLTDLGMDSLMALDIRRGVERLVGAAVPATLAFEYPTVVALADYLRDGVLALEAQTVPSVPSPTRESALTAPLAVVSMACRVPGAATPEAFWTLLAAGADQVQDVPATRWPVATYYDPQRPLPGKVYTHEGAFLAQVDQFDPGFFGIAPREAAGMDPQHRLLLEVSWEALERAGIAPPTLRTSRTGVFIGIGEGEYAGIHVGDDLTGMDSHAATAGGHSIAAGRIAYTLGLQGPTLAVDTACSSSLVAIHLACQSLRLGECDLALAGGVSLLLSPVSFVALAQMQALAPDGRCKTFDATADGYGRGEGAGVIVLKRLADAECDGDPILAVVRGSAVNHDGPSSGLTVPNKQAQEQLLRTALANAGVDAAAVGYIEAHGTGTPLGDPIELRAIGTVFAERQTPLAVGSVKTNIGHLEAAAGIAGVIKTVLALQHGVIPPHLHLKEPNPHVDWAALPVVVPTVATAWGGDGHPRLAGVSSFGFSGTNAHVVLESAPEASVEGRADLRPAHLFPIAAKDATALAAYGQAYVAYLDAHPDVDLADLCSTAQVGRSPFAHRRCVVAGSVDDLRAQLVTGSGPQGTVPAYQPVPQVAFLFTGQGSQYAGMGLELDTIEPTFHEALDACAAILDPLLGRPLRTVLTDPALIDQTTYTQPALFALEYALARMWQAWGIEPAILIGHSVGELVAACLAEVFSLEEGLKLVAARGRLMGDLPPDGSMVALAADEHRVREAVAPYTDAVSIAAVNGPTSVVISGRTDRVHAIAAQFAAAGIRTQALTVSHAFHSPLLDPMLEAFRAVAEGITYHPPTRRLVSNLTGGLAGADVTTPDYWVRHVREAVRFADGVQTLHAQGVDIFLEIGPKPVLLGMVESGNATRLPSLRPNQDSWRTLLTSLGTLYVRGAAVTWAGLHRNVVRHKIDLPTYPFQRQRYWVDAPAPAPRSDALRPLVDHMTRVARRGETIFEKLVSTATLPFLADHQIAGTVVVPGALHLALVLSGAGLLFADHPCVVEDVIFPQVLALAPDKARTVQLVVTAGSDGQPAPFEVISLDATAADAAEVLHATGRLMRGAADVPPLDIATLRTRCSHVLAPDDLYARIAAMQVDLGPQFRWFTGIWADGAGAALGQLRRPTSVPEVRGYPLFPSLIDACFQLVAAAEANEGEPITRLPFAVERLTWYEPGDAAELWCSVVRADTPAGATDTRWNLTLCTAAGSVVASIQGFQMRFAPISALQGTRLRTDWLMTLTWPPQPLPATQSEPPGCWLLVGGTDILAAELAPSAAIVRLPSTTDAATLRQQVADLAVQYPSLGVVFWLEEADAADAATAARTACTALLHLSQALITTSSAMRLWVVTSGAQDVAGYGMGANVVVGGSLWGFGRTLAREEPRLRCVLVDLDARPPVETQARTLAKELQHGTDAATEVAWRGELRFVARLEPWIATPGFTLDQPQRLQIERYGTLDALRYVPLTRRAPDPDTVEIQVHAAGLNFRDVLNSLGMLQDYYATALGIHHAQDVGLGLEAAGVVTAVGSNVTAYAVGDRVMGLSHDGAFASAAILPVATLAHIPAGMDIAAAATVPLAFLTAWYGLVELAQLQPGERILIHAASGGVGQAAVQIAQLIGATVIATASPGKWAILQQQGVLHLANSRTLEFADTVLALTNGQGVDVVLNSLSGASIDASFTALRRGGRFVEIGKLGIWSPAEATERRPDADYHAFDLMEVLTDDAILGQRLWQALSAQFAAGRLRPLPHTSIPAAGTVRAFRTMQQAQHVGKLVLDFRTTVALNPAASYLITGGLGALGLQVAEQLVADGARRLVLSSRRDVQTDAQRAAVADLAATGATVAVVPTDIGDAAQVQALLAHCATLGPLRGIVHAAGVLDDGVLAAQTPARLAGVFRPKAEGAWHLHTLSAGLDLDFFVGFSSLASLLGVAGQSTYAAANGFMDGLMQLRRAQGLPGLSINWGPWAEVGMAAPLAAQFQRQGQGMIAPAQGRILFRHLRGLRAGFIGILPHVPHAPVPPASVATLRSELLQLPDQERLPCLVAWLQQDVARILLLDRPALVDSQQPLFELGMDSLMAVELRNRLNITLGVSLHATIIFEYPTIDRLAPWLLDQLHLGVNGLDMSGTAQPLPQVPAKPSRQALAQDITKIKTSDLLAFIDQEFDEAS